MEEFRYLVTGLTDFIQKEKSIVMNTIMQEHTEDVTKGLRHRFEQIEKLETELKYLIKKAKELKDA